MANPPATFVDLSAGFERREQAEKSFSVIGVVIDFLPAAKTRGPHYAITFTLHDPSWYEGRGLKFRLFHREENKLPAIKENGDVVILRNVKTTLFNGSWLGASDPRTTWVVLPKSILSEEGLEQSIEVKKSPASAQPTPAEIQYAREIFQLEDQSTWTTNTRSTSLQVAGIMKAAGGVPTRLPGKFRLIEELRLLYDSTGLVFADLLGEVRRVWSNDYRVELSVTDYTSNPQLFDYVYETETVGGRDGDPHGYAASNIQAWPGPWGQMTMAVTLWDANADFGRSLTNGQVVFLRNVQIQFDRNGSKMEGHVRGDRQEPTKVNVVPKRLRDAEGDEQMISLLRRKRAYEEKAKEKNIRFVRDASNPKAKADVAAPKESKLSRSAARKQRPKPGRKTESSDDAQPLYDAERKPNIASDSNCHIACANVAIPLTTIAEILDAEQQLRRQTPAGNEFFLPFQNCTYRSKVRVVDYFPDDVADFAAPHRVSQYSGLSDHDSGVDSDVDMTQAAGDGHGHGDEVRWEWRFCLLVEDARAGATRAVVQMELLVTDDEGGYLLNMDACDLRRDAQRLARLKEKLFVLWGDLQELKEAAAAAAATVASRPHPETTFKPQARPFECFIKEYGMPARDGTRLIGKDQFERRFRLSATTIH